MIEKKEPAWENCFKILKDNGTLIVPVMKNMRNGDENLAELINILKRIGFDVNEEEFNENTHLEGRFNLLKQPPMNAFLCGITNWKQKIGEKFAPLVIIANKNQKII